MFLIELKASLLLAVIVTCWGNILLAQEQPAMLTAVDSVDLERYSGLWYEVAKIPNRFQKKCMGRTTARYTRREDGKIDVVNRCQKKDGKIEEISGIARVVDPRSNAKLEVSFFRLLGISLFWGDYWIIGLDPDYQYAVIGTPTRKYGWILARTPQLAPEKLAEAFAILRTKGYDTTQFELTVQDTLIP